MKYSYMLLLALNTLTITQISIGAELPEGDRRGPPICIRVRDKNSGDASYMLHRAPSTLSSIGSQSIESEVSAADSVEEIRSAITHEESMAVDPGEARRASHQHAVVIPEEAVEENLEGQRATIAQRICTFLRQAFSPGNIFRVLVTGIGLLLNIFVL